MLFTSGSMFNGGAEGDRTPDLGVANATLSHLSYGPLHIPIISGELCVFNREMCCLMLSYRVK